MSDIRQEIFKEVVKALKPYKKGLAEKTDGKTKYQLTGKKKVEIYNKEIDGLFFASATIMKNSVSFHYFCQYTHPQLLKYIPANLKKCLKGKTCFHIQKNDPELMKSLKGYAKLGYDTYKKMGWI